MSHPRRLWGVAGASQDRTKVNQIVPQVLAAVLCYQRVHAIDRSCILVIQPGGEDTQTTQHPPILMRNGVVRIVTPGSPVAERTNHLTLHPAARQRAIAAVRSFWLELEHIVYCLHRKRVLAPARITPCRASRDREVVAMEVDDIVFRCEKAERIKELAANDIRGRAQLRVVRGVEFQ